MSVEFDSFIAAGVDLTMTGTLTQGGVLKGGGKTIPAAGNATGSGMFNIRGVTAANPNIPSPDVVNIGGDGVSQGSFVFPALANPAMDLDKSVFDLLQDAIAQNTKVYAMGGIQMGVLKPNTNNPEDMCWIIQSMTKKKDQGLNGLRAWSGFWLPVTTAVPLGRQGFTDRAGASDRWRVITTPADQLFNGIAIDDTNFGTEGGCLVPFTNDWPLLGWRWTGNGVLAVYTLPRTPGEYSADQIIITVDGVLQVYTTAFTVSGLSVTFQSGHIPANNAEIILTLGFDPNA